MPKYKIQLVKKSNEILVDAPNMLAAQALAKKSVDQFGDFANIIATEILVEQIEEDGICGLCNEPLGDSPFRYHEVCPKNETQR